MKRKVVILTAFALVALLVAGGTMAWFTGTARANNEYRAGTIKVEVNNKLKGLKANTYLNPGDCFEGNITFKNTGNKRAYLRVKLTSIWEGTQEDANTDNVAKYDILEKQQKSGKAFEVEEIDMLDLDMEPDGKGSHYETYWVKKGDWWYYTKILKPGAETRPIINKLCFDGAKMDNKFQNAKFQLKVDAEAIQVTHKAYKYADGWDGLPSGVEKP